jgi:hypothetical protein
MMDLETAKAAILASLELDTPFSTSTSTSTTTTTTTTSTIATSPPPPPPEYLQLPQLPTPSLVLSIPSTSLIHILSHFNEWFTQRLETRQQLIDWVPSTIFAPTSLRTKQQKKKKQQQQTKISNNNNNNNNNDVVTVIKPSSPPSASFSTVVPKQEKKTLPPSPLPTAHETHWILSLLSRLNDLLDGDDLSLLRQLSKTLVEMIELSENKKQLGTKDGVSEEEELEESRARCWMIVAAISGIWKQQDLWNLNL